MADGGEWNKMERTITINAAYCVRCGAYGLNHMVELHVGRTQVTFSAPIEDFTCIKCKLVRMGGAQ